MNAQRIPRTGMARVRGEHLVASNDGVSSEALSKLRAPSWMVHGTSPLYDAIEAADPVTHP
jgi:hypothetical protein